MCISFVVLMAIETCWTCQEDYISSDFCSVVQYDFPVFITPVKRILGQLRGKLLSTSVTNGFVERIDAELDDIILSCFGHVTFR